MDHFWLKLCSAHVRSSHQRRCAFNSAQQQRDHYTLKEIEIFIKDKLPPDIDADFVFKYVATRIPDHLLHGVDIVYVGQFKHLIDKEVNALYQDGAIYVTNEQDNDLDLIWDPPVNPNQAGISHGSRGNLVRGLCAP